ncbi:serine/arginine repetitive matrix protein 1-like [Amphibalanus amphitrite]|uniref:serine/arginine repetitive matrix protein 1-like n=1 Tax=Amphibalanus amphitrite TaxID=1232801 RepID=UPI001C8FEAAE|nr:serine/arginine repetitive matrix protein 1-like [Amphibalanus amphitrite]
MPRRRTRQGPAALVPTLAPDTPHMEDDQAGTAAADEAGHLVPLRSHSSPPGGGEGRVTSGRRSTARPTGTARRARQGDSRSAQPGTSRGRSARRHPVGNSEGSNADSHSSEDDRSLTSAYTSSTTEDSEIDRPPRRKRAHARSSSRRHRRRARSTDSHRRRTHTPTPAIDMLDMSRVPVKSKQPPPPRALKLPTISAAAMQALANRATMVSVDEVVFPHAPPVDGARGQPRYPPLSPAAYLRGVTAIATYRAYFFPGAAIQWLSYVLWLQGQAGDLPTSALRDTDVKARTHIARYHMEYQDPASLTEAIGQALAAPAVYAPAPAPPPQQSIPAFSVPSSTVSSAEPT